MAKKIKAFSLIEMVLAMSIFGVMGFTLYGLFNSLTNTQSTSLGMQRFRNEALTILERMEDELKRAVCDEFSVYKNSQTIYSWPDYSSSFTKKEKINTEFKCVDSGDSLALSVGKPNNPQLFYTIKHKDNEIASDLDSEIKDLIKKGKGSFLMNETHLKERVLILRNIENSINLYGKNEKYEQGETNYLDGIPDNTFTGNAKHGFVASLGESIYHIEYRFWGPNNIDWDNDNSNNDGTGVAIKTWGDDPSRPADTLPLGMKIILVMIYNPDMYHVKASLVDEASDSLYDDYHSKDQYIVFEKVIIFKNGVAI